MVTLSNARILLAAMASAAILVSCAEPPAPKAVQASAPPIALAQTVIDQASAYRFYIEQAGAVTPTFADGAGIAEALKVGASYEPKQLLRGAIAYGAVVALQDPEFVAGVRRHAGSPEQRRLIAYEIMKDPAYVIGLEGSAGAAGLVVAALGADGAKVYEAGAAVKQSAYNVQRQAWSKAEVVGRAQRLAQVKSLSTTPVVGEIGETERLQRAAVGLQSLDLSRGAATPPYTPSVVRSLSIAALAVLDYAGETNLETLNALMAEPNTSSCASMAKLNLYQCLAVAKPHYEDVFCLGQHAMMDSGRCVIKASGMPEPYERRFVPTVRADAGYAPARK